MKYLTAEQNDIQLHSTESEREHPLLLFYTLFERAASARNSAYESCNMPRAISATAAAVKRAWKYFANPILLRT
jgi:hypothetical protein